MESNPSVHHILDARQFTRSWLEQVLFPDAAALQSMPPRAWPDLLAGRRLFHLFYEPSTRTRISFESAMSLLGGTSTGIDSWPQQAVEERLEDRVRVLNAYGFDALLIRYHEAGGAERAASVSDVPVINAGDGTGQHPTQALLDVYTLWRELGPIDGLQIALVGDLSYERSTRSLAYLLGKFTNITLYLVSPYLLRMRDEVTKYLVGEGVRVYETRDLREIAPQLDVVYLTRAHTPRLEHAERFDNGTTFCAVDRSVLARLPRRARVLHPLPRSTELSPDLDSDERIACFRQAQNGLFVRMALLTLLIRRSAAGGDSQPRPAAGTAGPIAEWVASSVGA